MPSFKDKFGQDPPAQGTAELSLRERNHIRSKLGIPNEPALSLYIETETRMRAFEQERVDEARALYKALDRVGDKTSRLEGGQKGIYADKAQDRGVLRRELMNLIVPTNEIIAAEQISSGDDEAGVDEIVSVPVRYSNASEPVGEYGLRDE